MSDPVIHLRDVSKRFGANVVLDEVSLKVREGETLAILGGSGSGKSVTLKTINGLVPCDSGSIRVLDREIVDLSEAELTPLRRRVSYLFQGGALFDSMTVFENIAFPLTQHLELKRDELRERVEELLEMVELEGVGELDPSELSGGMRKRVALARALALRPEVILYDEPTTGLDPVTGETIADLILDLDRRFGVTSMVVTHDISLVRRVAERVVFLEEGRFVFSGTVEEAARATDKIVSRYFSAGGGDAR